MKKRKDFKIKKICSLFLLFTMFLVTNINPVSAHALTNVDPIKYMNPDKNNGVYLIENLTIDGKNYRFTHSIKDGKNVVKISGAENHTIVADNTSNKLYIDNELTSSISAYDDWTYFGPDIVTVSWHAGASTAVVAAALAGAVGGPVGAFLGAASALAGVSVGATIHYSGRYRFEGTHIRGEYTGVIYAPTGAYIATTNWSGYR